MGIILKTKTEKNRNYLFIVIVLMILLIGTLYYNGTEGWSYLDSFYFSTITLTTIGYGDFAPQTDSGKIFTSFYAIFGIGLMLYLLGIIVNAYIFEQKKIFGKINHSLHKIKQTEAESEELLEKAEKITEAEKKKRKSSGKTPKKSKKKTQKKR